MKNDKLNEILFKYTVGETTVEETNAALKEIGSSLYIDPMRKVITPDEMATGRFGYLDDGISLEKVEVDLDTMELVNCDVGEMKAFFFLGGKRYDVKGKKLV